ncbi:MAG TPA: hypothetical protein VHF26_16075 [Trebonia sp.]|nr:hypothetical protein [Trebonia sp.]
MTAIFLTLGLGALAFAGVFLLAEIGIRDGDRPDDVRVSVEAWTAGQPDEQRPVLIAEIRNPSAAPVLAGLTARRSRTPGLLAASTVSVPLRTTRRGLRADDHDTVGIVPEFGTARFTVPVESAARRYRLTVAVGQRDRRLRLHRIYISAARIPRPMAKTAIVSGASPAAARLAKAGRSGSGPASSRRRSRRGVR